MTLELTTPALLFSTISLLMLAYTNRFLAVAKLIRDLHDRYIKEPTTITLDQIKNLKRRVILIRNMQLLAISSLLLSVVCMALLFNGLVDYGKMVFGISLILMSFSLSFSVWEIVISINALKLELSDIEEKNKSFLEKLF